MRLANSQVSPQGGRDKVALYKIEDREKFVEHDQSSIRYFTPDQAPKHVVEFFKENPPYRYNNSLLRKVFEADVHNYDPELLDYREYLIELKEEPKISENSYFGIPHSSFEVSANISFFENQTGGPLGALGGARGGGFKRDDKGFVLHRNRERGAFDESPSSVVRLKPRQPNREDKSRCKFILDFGLPMAAGASFLMCSERIRDVFERFASGVCDYQPIEFVDSDILAPDGKYFFWDVKERFVSIDLDKTAAHWKYIPEWQVYYIGRAAQYAVLFDEETIAGRHLFFDPTLNGDYIVSEELKQALISAGLAELNWQVYGSER